MKRKTLAIALALVMCLGLIPMPAMAADGDFVVKDGVLTGYNGPGGDVTIPSGVTTIGSQAFKRCLDLTSVTIPEGVTEIRWRAFDSCTHLTSVTIPGSVTVLGDRIFDSCTGLTTISVSPENPSFCSVDGILFSRDMTRLVRYPAARTESSYTVPGSVTEIGMCAFSECVNLTNAVIPDSVVRIGNGAFKSSEKLNQISVSDGNTQFVSVDGVLFSRDMTKLYQYPIAKQASTYAIPDGVTEIGEAAFTDCTALTGVTIPDSVNTISMYAFMGCSSLTELPAMNGVTTIGWQAFSYCDGLTGVVIPGNVLTLDGEAFYGCANLTSAVISAGVTSIGYEAFLVCRSLTSVTIPATVTKIEGRAFDSCDKLTDIYYTGTEEQWKAVSIEEPNEALASIPIHFSAQTPIIPDLPVGAHASPTNDTLTVNGVVQNATVYKIDGSNYFKIRDLAAVLNGTGKQFEVGYDPASHSVTATTGQGYTPAGGELAGAAAADQTAALSNDTILVNGEQVSAQVYKIDGSNYFKLRDLGAALGFDVGWSAEQGIFINTEN